MTVLAPGSRLVTAQISRGRRAYALDSAVVRHGAARLALSLPRGARRGRYLITIVITGSRGQASVIRYTRRLG